MMPRFCQLCLFFYLLMLRPVYAAVVFGVVPAEQAGAGLSVARVAADTPACAAGLQSGDVLTEVQGTRVTDAVSLRHALASYNAGDVVRVRYVRGGKLATALVELAARPEPCAPQTHALAPVLPPELKMQLVQAKSRLRIQLSRLPNGMDAAQVRADLQELLILARGIPGNCEGWMQGSGVETSLSFADAEGYVVLRAENEHIFLELKDKNGKVSYYSAIGTAQPLQIPPHVVQRLQKL